MDLSGVRVVHGWRRPTAPVFMGGAEVGEQILLRWLAASGAAVRSIGSYENARNGTLHNLTQLESHLGRRVLAGSVVRYTVDDIACVCVAQRDLEGQVRRALLDGADVFISTQEGSDELVSHAARLGVATMVTAHSASSHGLAGLRAAPDVAFAVSNFVADAGFALTGRRPRVVGVPLLDPDPRPPGPRNGVLFVNPVPEKGAAIAAKLAMAMPDEQFTFFEGWYPVGQSWPTNVDVRPRSRHELLAAMCRSSALIVPSLVDDAFPRVISEAGLRGLPTVAAARGGISEAMPTTTSELLLDPADFAAWHAALVRLLGEAGENRAAAESARAKALEVQARYWEAAHAAIKELLGSRP